MFENAFGECTSLNKITFPKLTSICNNSLESDPILKSYKILFNTLLLQCKTEEQKEEYKILLRTYKYDYRQTVLAIETSNK